MRRIIFLACLLLMQVFKASGAVTIDGIRYNLNSSKKTAEVTSKSDYYKGSVVIPSQVTYNKIVYSVTSIGYKAFSSCSGLTSITIPNSVTCIGVSAFNGCTSLASITIPNSVTSIGQYAFSGTQWLENQPNGLVYAGLVAYSYKGSMPNDTVIVLREGTKGIAGNAFLSCSKLNRVSIPNSVTSIGELAFYGCTGLTSITIPNSVTSIGEWAFYNCSNLTSINIPEGVTNIGDYTFFQCSSLTSITIPNSVTSIGKDAFYRCSKLKYISIPNSVTSIGEDAFFGCSGLNYIIVKDGNTKYDSRSNCNAIIETATNTLIVGCKNSFVPYNVTSIGDNAFSECSGLTSIAIGKSVTSIGKCAFDGCSGLTTITFPEGLTSIGDYAFYACSGLTTITFPEGLTSIGDYAFYACRGFTSIKSPSTITSIGVYAFSHCYNLTSVTIPSFVTYIGNGAFYDCDELADIYCSADPTKLTWNGRSDFMKSKQTQCHVFTNKLEAFQTKFGDIVNVTFVGDLRERLAKVEAAGKDSQIDDVIYDLNGRRVEGQLPTGIYIKNGKKYIVK